MYLSILKKDLKRKKTMNLILLLFSILATMFGSSGLSNVVTVMNGTEYFLDKAGIGDYVVITQNGDGGVTKILEESEYVNSFKTEKCHWATKSDVKVNGKKITANNNTFVVQPYTDEGISYFLADNTKLSQVNEGEVYVTAGFLKNNNATINDSLTINLGNNPKTYTIVGEIKDALLGSDMMGNTRIIFNQKDYEEFSNNKELDSFKGAIYYIETDDIKSIAAQITDARNVLFSDSRSVIKKCYIMEMIVAMIVLVLSVVLCIVAFFLLKYVIAFTISEEVRELGVMKAIGINNKKIRKIYIVKYFMMAIVGGIIGFFIGIPFGKILIKSVSQKMLLGQDYGLVINILGTIVVITIMITFAYISTAIIKKYSPVDAIRDGQKGERYSKRTKVSISKSKMNNSFFMALNDVLSAPKRFITIILTFFICSVFVFGVVLVVDTMNSDRLIECFGKKSDVYITDSKFVKMDLMSKDGNVALNESIKNMETDLEKLDIAGDVSMEVWYKYLLTVDDKSFYVTFQQNKRTEPSEYSYTKGVAPQNSNEIAITEQIATQMGIEIGDTVTIDFITEKKDCIVVAYFQTMNQLGSVIRLHQDAPTNMEYASAMMAYQINFKDKVTKNDISERIDIIKDYYEIDDVFDAAEYCDDCMKVASTLDNVARLLLGITCIIVMLVTVLMERSFIVDETNQIALLKAIGFNTGFVMKWHIYRFLIVTIIAQLLAIVFTYPITKLWCDPIFAKMGATDVNYLFKPLSLIIIYPGIIVLINLIVVGFTALYTKKIKSYNVRNIE